MHMERSKPLPLLVFIGCILTMVSLLVTFGLNFFLPQPSGIYRSQPLANLAGIIVLFLGIILVYAGSRKAE
jgi:hypothetical protein